MKAYKLIVLIIFIALSAFSATQIQPMSETQNAIHPWAVYLLYGNLADAESSIVSVDLNAVKKSNDISSLKLFDDGSWIGFRNISTDDLESFDFKYRKLAVGRNEYVLQCVYNPYGSSTFSTYLLTEIDQQEFWSGGKLRTRDIITSLGEYTFEEIMEKYPSVKENINKSNYFSNHH